MFACDGKKVWLWPVAVLTVVVCTSGCQKYRPAPLVPDDVFRTLAAQRRPERDAVAPIKEGEAERAGADRQDAKLAKGGNAFTLKRAADWLRTNGPDVQESLAEYRTALAVARVDTPLPNPGLEIGPQFGFGPDLGPVNRATPFGSIGFTIPLGKRLRRQTELNRAIAEVARVHAKARFREIYLELRDRYTTLVIARQRLAIQKEIADSSAKTLQAVRQMVQAGQATSLDVVLFDLEHQRSLVEVVAAERSIVETEGELSGLLGIHYDAFRTLSVTPLPKLPARAPDYEELRERLILNHTELGRLRAAYEAAERGLRLEISKQFPDLQIGPGWDNEVGEKMTVIGLTLGIEIPLFDRNQQGIAEAKKKREEIRAKYEAEAKRALAGLERAHRDLVLARKQVALLREKILPLARTHVELAKRSIEAGAADALRLLEAERSERKTHIETRMAELEECQAWIALEQAVGVPLIAFPSEQEGKVPVEPEGLDEENGK